MNEILLTQKLIKFNTINPPGNEQECVLFVGQLLQGFGMTVQYYDFDEKRTSLIASFRPQKHQKSICFNGHIDTVPLGVDKWDFEPLAGEIISNKIYGRGSSDMKSGVAAIIIAIKEFLKKNNHQNIDFILTAGEEIGCQGAHFLKKSNYLPPDVGALIVAEPTANYPYLGHKGVLWLKVKTKGVTAHGSMPEKGLNAITSLIKVFNKLENFQFNVTAHPVFGHPTINVGMINGGQNINSVPDEAYFTIDIRTIVGQDQETIIQNLNMLFKPNAEIEVIESVNSIYSDPNDRWLKKQFKNLSSLLKMKIEPKIITYGTDASYLKEGLNHPPTVIIGPGEPQMAHKTNEYCFTNRITEAKNIYLKMLEDWSEFC